MKRVLEPREVQVPGPREPKYPSGVTGNGMEFALLTVRGVADDGVKSAIWERIILQAVPVPYLAVQVLDQQALPGELPGGRVHLLTDKVVGTSHRLRRHEQTCGTGRWVEDSAHVVLEGDD